MTKGVVSTYPKLQKKFFTIKSLKKQHAQVGYDYIVSNGGTLYFLDLYIIGTLKRSIDLLDAISLLTQKWNPSSIPLLRLQIDSLIRLTYLVGQKNAEDLCREILINGKSFRDLKNDNGKPLFDVELVNYSKQYFPWIEKIYKETSKFIHYSDKHFMSSLINVGKKKNAQFAIAPGLENWPEKELDLFLQAVILTTENLLEILKELTKSRKNHRQNN